MESYENRSKEELLNIAKNMYNLDIPSDTSREDILNILKKHEELINQAKETLKALEPLLFSPPAEVKTTNYPNLVEEIRHRKFFKLVNPNASFQKTLRSDKCPSLF